MKSKNKVFFTGGNIIFDQLLGYETELIHYLQLDPSTCVLHHASGAHIMGWKF